jgi:hypothetical protein
MAVGMIHCGPHHYLVATNGGVHVSDASPSLIAGKEAGFKARFLLVHALHVGKEEVGMGRGEKVFEINPAVSIEFG